MLAKEESLIPRMFTNLRRGITPLLDDGIYKAMQVGRLAFTVLCVV